MKINKVNEVTFLKKKKNSNLEKKFIKEKMKQVMDALPIPDDVIRFAEGMIGKWNAPFKNPTLIAALLIFYSTKVCNYQLYRSILIYTLDIVPRNFRSGLLQLSIALK